MLLNCQSLNSIPLQHESPCKQARIIICLEWQLSMDQGCRMCAAVHNTTAGAEGQCPHRRMRRGGRGSNVRAPRTGHDHAIPSALHNLGRRWAARRYVQVITLAACSIAITTVIWSLRHEPHLLGHNLQSGNRGFVLPLYHYYQQFPNGSRAIGGRSRWRGGRGVTGRGIHSDGLKSLFDLHGGHRPDETEMEQFYIEMKLGDPPKPFYFHIDTGSGPMWVYCTNRGRPSSITDFGPHGMFDPPKDSYANCTGPTAALCQALQAKEEKCDRSNNFECIFSAEYVDGFECAGLAVNGSVALQMRDNTERNVFGLFGCVVWKIGETRTPPLITDGAIGLGNCMGTLLDQLSASSAVRQNVLGICLAREMQWPLSTQPARLGPPVGFISLGMGFEEKFDQSNSVWVKLTALPPLIGSPCAFAADLLSISTDKGYFTGRMAIAFDTGSDWIFLHRRVYAQVLQALEVYTTNGDYFRVKDNEFRPPSQQRACWEYRGGKRRRSENRRTKASPIHDFRPLKLGFEGIGSGRGSAPLQYLIIQPENYLAWDEDVRKVCVNIVQDTMALVSNIGSQAMREHLFVFDIEHQRVRWKVSSNCET